MFSIHIRTMIACAVAAVALLAGCGPRDTPEPLQAVELNGFLPIVRDQLTSGYAAVTKKPRSASAYGRLGMMLQVYEQFPEAAVAYERALARDPKNPKWTYLLAHVRVKQGQADDAIELFARSVQLDPDYLSAGVRLGDLLLLAGRLDEARAALEQVVHEDANDAEAHFYLGEVEMRAEKYQLAIEHYERATQLSEGAGVAHYALAMAYRTINDSAQSERHFAASQINKDRRPSRIDPWLQELRQVDLSDTPLIKRAESLGVSGRFAEALELLNEAIRRNPNSLSAHTTLVGLHATLGNFDLSDAHFAEAQKLQPDHPKLYYNLGIARMQEQRMVEAARAFTQAIKLEPGFADAHVQLGVTRRLQGDTSAAIKDLEKALTLSPLHRQGNWQLGELLIESGDIKGGADHLKRVAHIEDPASPTLFLSLGRANLELQQPDDAHEAFTNALRTAKKYSDNRSGAEARKALRALNAERVTTP